MATHATTEIPTTTGFFKGDWQRRLEHVVEMMRDMSRQTDPEEMVQSYGKRYRQFMPSSRFVALSRRDLAAAELPDHAFESLDPSTQPLAQAATSFPCMRAVCSAELLYGEEPRIIDDLVVHPDDPAAEYCEGQRS